jgi:hypothetical protein
MKFMKMILTTAIRKIHLVDPAYFSLGVGVGRIASGENTVCRRDLDQSMPGCKDSRRLVFAVWNRDQGSPGGILRQSKKL